MPTPRQLEDLFWEALEDDRTVMLGLDGVEEGHTRPMGAHFENRRAPIWFFTTRDNPLVRNLRRDSRAIVTFASKGHELFAAIHGDLRPERNRQVLDRLWNRHTAVWYEEGKDDPELALLRLDPDHAEIWQNASGFAAGIRILFGSDPKVAYRERNAEVMLRR